MSERIEEGKIKILNSLIERKGAQFILDTASEVLGNPIFVGDSCYKVFMCSNVNAPEKSDLFWEGVQRTGLTNREDVMKTFSGKEFRLMYQQDEPVLAEFSFIPHRLLGARYRDGINVFGHIVIYECRKSFEEEDRELLQILCKVFAYEMLYRGRTVCQDIKYYNVMSFLLEGKTVKEHDIQMCLEAAHIRLPEMMYAGVLCGVEYIAEVILRELCRNLQREIGNRISFPYENVIIIIVDKKKIQDIEGQLDAFCKSYRMRCGFSYEFDDIHQLSLAYHQAKYAWSYLKEKEEKRVNFYEECSFFELCDWTEQDLKKLCHPALLRLLEEDKKRNSNHMEVLDLYLKYHGNVQKAAEEMCIHKNTMYYRLERLEQFFGKSLQDGEFCFNLEISLKILQYLKEI